MHARVEEVTQYLAATRRDLRQEVELVPEALRTQRPEPDRWSVAELLEHLAIVEGRIVNAIRPPFEAALASGLSPERETSSILPSLDTAAVADRTTRREAGEPIRPRGGLDAAAAFTRLEGARAATLDLFLRGDGLALGEVIVPNPVMGPLNLYQWGLFVGGHEARHTGQLREIRAALLQV